MCASLPLCIFAHCDCVHWLLLSQRDDLFDWPRLLFASLPALITMQLFFFHLLFFFPVFATKPLRLGERRVALASRAERRRLSALVQLSINGCELHQ